MTVYVTISHRNGRGKPAYCKFQIPSWEARTIIRWSARHYGGKTYSRRGGSIKLFMKSDSPEDTLDVLVRLLEDLGNG